MEWPAVSIVVPTYQRRDLVCDALRAIAAVEYPGELEAIVVVDGSTDGTAAALARIACPFPVRIVEQANAGAARARNAGAALARGDILLFLDDDMICRPDIVRHHARSMSEGADAVLGALTLDPGSSAGFLAEAVGRWSEGRNRALAGGAPIALFDLLTGQLSVRRAVFEALGGFDEAFTAGGRFGNEDLDFGVRLLDGHAVRFNAEAVSAQRYDIAPRRHLQQWFDAGQADVAFARKHPAHAAALFAAHRPASLRTRLIYRPLAALPRAVGLARWAAVRLAEGATADARLRARLFFAAREVVYWAGVRAAGGMPRARAALVLCYHAIADLSADRVLAEYGLAPEAFVAQLEDLRRRAFAFIAPDELLAALDGRGVLPRRAVLVTFDDCYAELARVAATILRPRGIPALAFAVSGVASGTNEWDQAIGAGRLPLLDAEGLAALREHGVEIGAHARTHRPLPALGDEELVQETGGAARDLERMGLPHPRFLAYPYGASDARAQDAVRAAGFAAAFGLRRARASARSNRFDLPRVEILARDKGWRFTLKTGFPRLSAALGI